MVSFALSVSTVWTRPLVQEAEDVRYAEVCVSVVSVVSCSLQLISTIVILSGSGMGC